METPSPSMGKFLFQNDFIQKNTHYNKSLDLGTIKTFKYNQHI